MYSAEDFNLREIEKYDLELILKWRNSERIRTNMFTDHIITMQEHAKWFERIKHDSNSLVLIFEKKTNPLGLVSFTGIDKKNSKCNWGFYLGEINLPGTGTIMGYLGLNYAFEKLKIRKVCGEVFAFNSASIKFFNKLGFIEEGRLRKHILKNGIFEDVVLFGLLKEEWHKRKVELAEKV